MTFTKQQLEEVSRSVPSWFHSIDLGQGVVTAGHKSQRQLAVEVEDFRFPDLRGRSVLDIDARDGFYSFEAVVTAPRPAAQAPRSALGACATRSGGRRTSRRGR